MRAPGQVTRSADDIFDDFLELVGIEKGENFKTEMLIRAVLNGLRLDKSKPPATGQRKANKQYADKLRAWIEEGKELLSAPPEGLNLRVLFAADTALNMKIAAAREQCFVDLLGDMRERCFLVAKLGRHGNTGYLQNRAAIAARILSEHCGWQVVVSSKEKTQYRTAASLFYESMTGKPEQELEDACEAIARLKTDAFSIVATTLVEGMRCGVGRIFKD
jgi:hypothetical protein